MKNYKTARSLYNNIYKNYHDNRAKASNDVAELPVVLNLLGDLKGKKLLDVGCGLGTHSKEFIKRGAAVTGFDASEKMIALTKENCKGKGNFFRADYKTVSFEPNSFDVVNASMSLNYSKDPDAIVKNISLWLKKNGLFTFSIPHPIWLFTRVEKMDFSKPHRFWVYIDSYDVSVFNYYYPIDHFIQIFNNNHLRLVNLIETTTKRKYKGRKEEKYRLPSNIVFKLQKL